MNRTTRRTTWPALAVTVAALLGACSAPANETSDLPTTPAAAPAAVEVVDLSTAAQAAIAVSDRLFDTSPVAVLTTPAELDAAIDAAADLGVPVLMDDPASPAELARLRAATVLTFGAVEPGIFGALAADDDPATLERQIAALGSSAEPPEPVDTIVALQSSEDFAAASATATTAGATVVEGSTDDLRARFDDAVALAVMRRPDADVIALGAPFTATFSYAVSVLRADAQQIGGGFLALPDRLFLPLHGRVGDPSLGFLGADDLAGSIELMDRVAGQFADRSGDPVVPTLEVVATAATDDPGPDGDYVDPMSVEDLTAVVDVAEEAGFYVLVDLQPGGGSLMEQARTYADVLARDHVGLTLEPARSREPVSAGDIDAVGAFVADLTRRSSLPQKLFVVRDTGDVSAADLASGSRPELALVLGVDLVGDRAEKLAAWRDARTDAPEGASYGWTQYRDLDDPALTVPQFFSQVEPFPSVITFQ